MHLCKKALVCLIVFLGTAPLLQARAETCPLGEEDLPGIQAALDAGDVTAAQASVLQSVGSPECPIGSQWLSVLRDIAVIDPYGDAHALLRQRSLHAAKSSETGFIFNLAELEIAARRAQRLDAGSVGHLLGLTRDLTFMTRMAEFVYRIRDAQPGCCDAALVSWATESLRSDPDPEIALNLGMYLATVALERGAPSESLALSRRNLMFLAQAPDLDHRRAEVLRTIAVSHAKLGNKTSAMAQFEAARQAFLMDRDAILKASRADPSLFRWRAGRVFLDYARFLTLEAQACVDSGRREELLMTAISVLEDFKRSELDQLVTGLCPSARRDIPQLISAIPADALIIYPARWSQNEHSLFALSRSGIEVFDFDRTPSELDSLARRLRADMEARDEGFLGHAAELHQTLVQPVQRLLASGGFRQLGFVPDAALRLVPLSVAHDGNGFLIERYPVTTAPTLEQLLQADLGTRQAGTPTQILVGALDEARGGYPALPGVAKEADFLMRRFGATRAVVGLRNADFTGTQFKAAAKTTPSEWIHLATHGEFLPQANQSFLLTYDGQMKVAEILDILGNRPATGTLQLLSLTACETASGDDRAALGMAGLLLGTGAKSVLASLWSLRDAAAPPIVSDFYSALSMAPEQPATALQRAQIAAIRSPDRAAPDDWAPFLILGHLNQ